MKTTFVTAYYDIPNKFKGSGKYMEWMGNFLSFIRTMPLIIFSTGDALKRVQQIISTNPKAKNIVVQDLPFEQFYTHTFRPQLEQQTSLDPERRIHTVELYMIWNEKPHFVRRAIEIDPHQSTHYCWFDIGMIRDSRLSEWMMHFPQPQGLEFLYDLKKLSMLAIQTQNLERFRECDTQGISIVNKNAHTLCTVAGGFLFGLKEQYQWYIQEYSRFFQLYLEQNVFVGKDQNLIANIVITHQETFVLLDVNRTNIWLNTYQKDKWFYMINILSGTNSSRSIHTPRLMGGLGNRLFQVASIYGIARTRGELFVLNQSYCDRNAHSPVQYLDSVFNRFFEHRHAYIYRHDERQLHSHNHELYTQPVSSKLYIGYFQNYLYFENYLDDLRKLFRFPLASPTPTFFIHFRFGDFVNNRNHYVDLKKYYKKCLSYIQQDLKHKYPHPHFYAFSNDPNLCKNYIAQHLPELDGYYTYIHSDEQTAMAQMIQCTHGGICSNSTFSWWGAMLNPNPDKFICFPDKIYPHTSMYKECNISGMFHPSFTIFPTENSENKFK